MKIENDEERTAKRALTQSLANSLPESQDAPMPIVATGFPFGMQTFTMLRNMSELREVQRKSALAAPGLKSLPRKMPSPR